jgi:hypothetical protein
MNKIIPNLKNALPQKEYKLFVEFEDGIKGIIDLQKWKGRGEFDIWNDEENFKQFTITADKKIEWSKKIDMDPDAFYLQLVGKTFEEYAGNQQLLRNID